MNRKKQLALAVLLFSGVGLLILLLALNRHGAILNPQGQIADRQRSLIITSTLLMLIVVVPVYVMTFAIAWKYRSDNTRAKYTPDWDGHRLIESSWWVIPGIIILILGVITWKSSHELDPFRSLNGNARPLTIQVVALQWRWLFIYPDQNIASLNTVHLPTNTPINFEITSDAPMNSFWIPQLGGQIYAMSGMATHLHLLAEKPGDYYGSSANISGAGFADMTFTVKADNNNDFQKWLATARRSGSQLSRAAYDQLARPSRQKSYLSYAGVENYLFQQVIAKYTSPTGDILTAGHQHSAVGD